MLLACCQHACANFKHDNTCICCLQPVIACSFAISAEHLPECAATSKKLGQLSALALSLMTKLCTMLGSRLGLEKAHFPVFSCRLLKHRARPCSCALELHPRLQLHARLQHTLLVTSALQQRELDHLQVRDSDNRFYEACNTTALLSLEKYGQDGSDLDGLPEEARTLLQDKDTLLNAVQVIPASFPDFIRVPSFKLLCTPNTLVDVALGQVCSQQSGLLYVLICTC